MFNLLKKLVLYSLLVLGIMYGYQYMTGKSIATLPREIVNKLQKKGPAEPAQPKYIMTPADKIPN